MKVVKETDLYIILDDVLSESEFALFREYTEASDYARNPNWIKPWDLADQMPWQTGETVYTRGKQMRADDPRRAYPTGLAIDLLFDRIVSSKYYRKHFPNTYVTARTYLHPPGSGLDWHDDGGRFQGAYTFYAHPSWHASWGGELLIVEDELGRRLLPDRKRMKDGKTETVGESWSVLYKEDLSTMLFENVTSTEFVFPKPNRLVFLKGGLWHKICLVKPAAPFARCAVAGFFLTDEDPVNFWRQGS
jgi:hypothetical protein